MATVWKYVKMGIAYMPIYGNPYPVAFSANELFQTLGVLTPPMCNAAAVGDDLWNIPIGNGSKVSAIKTDSVTVNIRFITQGQTLYSQNYKTNNTYPYSFYALYYDGTNVRMGGRSEANQNNINSIFSVWIEAPRAVIAYKNNQSNGIGGGSIVTRWSEIFDGVLVDQVPTDPYSQDGESDTGGGTGDFDGTGDNIDIPGLPTLSATDTGFITLFNPSTAQLKSLANYMWSSGFDLDTFKKLFADPMDCILGLSIVPVAVPNGGSSAVSVGNISTGVSMTKAAAQYVAVDCGTLNVNEYWGAYLDYDPYTKAEIYLPYIGTHALAVDDIMGKAVHVVYHVDILSGACAAYVKCGSSVLYTFIGQCSSSIPITGNDWTNVINGVLTAAGAIGSMVATGGASAPLAVPALASTAVNGMKPTVEKSGSMSGTGGMLGIQTPYLILTRPRQAVPAKQNEFMGYPSFITKKLSNVSGYTEIESVHLENISATEQELSEIESLLKGGVIL